MRPMFAPPRRPVEARLAAVALAALLVACGSPQALPTPTPAPVLTPSFTPAPLITSSPSPAPTSTPKPKPKPKPPSLDRKLLARRITVLVAGIDSNPVRKRRNMPVNTDAMIVVSVNRQHNRIAMVSLPRDTVDIPLKGGGVWPRKINSLYAARGINALQGALSRTYGVRIDYHLALNMSDFGHLVNAVGGVTIKVPYALHDATVHLDLSAGRHHFNGSDALRYARTRHYDSDFRRQARQQQVLMAVFHKLVKRHVKLDFRHLVRTLDSLKTDLPLRELPTLLEIGRRSADARVSREVLGPGYARFMGIEPNSGRGWVIIPDVARMRAYVRSVMR